MSSPFDKTQGLTLPLPNNELSDPASLPAIENRTNFIFYCESNFIDPVTTFSFLSAHTYYWKNQPLPGTWVELGTGGGGNNTPTNTVYVRVPGDFGPIAQIGVDDYHIGAVDTQFIILENLNMTAGVSLTGASQIRSGNREQATFNWQGFTLNSPIIYNGSGKVILDSIKFTQSVTLTDFLISCTSGLGSFEVKNCIFENFESVFEVSGTPSILFQNNIGTGISQSGLFLFNVAQSIVHNNSFSLSGGGASTAIQILGSSESNSRISDNSCNNGSHAFVHVNNSIVSTSRIAITGNKTSDPANFFGGGSLTPADDRIYSSGNFGVVNSKAFMSATDTLGSDTVTTIDTVNIAEEVTGRVIQANSLNTFFNVTNIGVPTVPKVTYIGSSIQVFNVTIRALLSTAMGGPDLLSLGLFLDGAALGTTFVPTSIGVTSKLYVSSSILFLAPNENLTFAVRNNSDDTDIVIASLGISISQIT